MKYYSMSQDKRIHNVFELIEFPGKEAVDLDSSYADRLKDNTALFTKETENSLYPQMLDAPLTMVEKEIYEVIRMYDQDVIFKGVSIINREKQTNRNYYLALIDRLDCLHESSEFHKDNSVIKLVLDKKKVNNAHIFKIKGISKNTVVVSMDIVESILRRGCFGISFEEITCR